MNKIIAPLLMFLLVSGNLAAQSDVEMADTFRANGKIYVVVAIMSVIFLGIIVYLFLIDRKVSRIEKKQSKN